MTIANSYRRILRTALTLAAAGLVWVVGAGMFAPEPAQAAINQQINFQGRLLTPSGAVVADGNYNMEFKIWQGGNGCVSGCTAANADTNNGGTLKWTEDWIYGSGTPDNRVTVKNGYFSVSLGSLTALSAVDFTQSTLWLSMNVGDTSNQAAFATSGGYLIPFKRLSSSVYAFQASNSDNLGGVVAANYLQFGSGNLQADGSTNNSINFNKTASGNMIRIQSSGADAFIVDNTGNLQFGANGNHTVSVVTNGSNAAGKTLTIQAGSAGAGATGFAGGTLTLQGGNAAGTTGNANGGDVMLYGGTAVNSGTAGNVVLAYNGSSAVGGVGVGKTPTSGVALDVSGNEAVSGTLTVTSAVAANGGLTATKTLTVNSGTTQNVTSITFTSPADSSGTNVSQGLNISPTIGNATAGTNTANIINIGAVTGDAQVSLNALNIGALTGTAAAENAINVGSGWDNVLNSSGALNFTGAAASTWNINSANLTVSTTTSGNISVSSAGTLALSSTDFVVSNTGTVTTGTWQGTAVGAQYGGTGQSTYAIGDLLYASSTSALSRLAVGTGSQCLIGGTTPAWGSCATGGLVQVPTSNTPGTNGANVIQPTAASISGLTVNGTSSATGATSLIVNQAGATSDGVDLNLTSTTTGPQVNGLLVNRNGTGGTTTNGIQIQQAAGTLTNGLAFGGTIGTDIYRASGTLSIDTGASQTIAVGNSANAHTINVGTGAAVQGVTVGSTNTTSITNIEGGTSGNISTPSIGIGNGPSNHTIEIGTNGLATNSVYLGTTTGTSSTTLAGGTGNINLNVNQAGAGVVVQTQTNNSVNAFRVQGSSATVLNVDTTINKLTVTSSGAAATVGSELITTTDFTNATWTKTGWTATTTTAAHSTGNTSALSTNQFSAVSGGIYQVTFTVTGSPTAGETVTPYIGVATSAGSEPVSGNGTFVEAISQSGTLTPALEFVPTSNWNGTISAVSVKLITPTNAGLSVNDSGNNAGFQLEVRTTGVFGNTFVGYLAGEVNTTGNRNTGIGSGALSSDTTGAENAALGYNSMQFNTTGNQNAGFGRWALQGNVSGSNNTAIGYTAGISNTTGTGNTFVGSGANLDSTVAGQLQNATAIGVNSDVSQSDSLVLGCISGVNSCTATTKVGIGVTAPTAQLDVRGTSLVKTSSTTAFQIQGSSSSANLFQVDTAGNNITLGGNNSPVLQTWATNTSTYNATATSGAVTVTANGYVYYIGGWTSAAESTNVNYAPINANGSVGTFGTTTNTGFTGVSGAMGVVASGYVYVMGGSTTNAAAGSVTTVQYARIKSDGTLGGWVTTSALGTAVMYGTAVAANGYVYVMGGVGTGGSAVSTVQYAKLNADGSTGTWATTSALPTATAYADSVVANGYMYFLGGCTTTCSSTAVRTIFYTKLGTGGTFSVPTCTGGTVTTNWCSAPAAQQLADTNGLRGETAVVEDGYVYLLGGVDNSSVNGVTAVYYSALNSDGSLGTNTSNANALPAGRTYGGSVVVNGYVYFLGGATTSAQTTASNAVYYASTQRVQVGGSLDLVGLEGQTLNSPGSSGIGSTGGSLTAGNIQGVGTLTVQGEASFVQSVSIGNNLQTAGYEEFQNSADSTSSFMIQNASGTTLINGDTSNMQVTINSAGVPLVLNSTTSTGEDGIWFNKQGSVNGEIGISNSASQITGNSAAGDMNVKSVNGNVWLAAGGVNAQVEITTSSLIVGKGSSGEASGTAAKTLVVDSSDTAPTAVNGGMYYNTTDNTFECGVNGAWTSCGNGLLAAMTSNSNSITGTTYASFTGASFTPPSGDCQTGVTYLITAGGYYNASNNNTNSTVIRFQLTQNGTAVMNMDESANSGLGVSGAAQNVAWQLNMQITCQSLNNAMASGMGTVEINRNFAIAPTAMMSSTSGWARTGTFAVTNGGTWQLQGKWANLGTATSFVVTEFLVQRLAP